MNKTPLENHRTIAVIICVIPCALYDWWASRFDYNKYVVSGQLSNFGFHLSDLRQGSLWSGKHTGSAINYSQSAAPVSKMTRVWAMFPLFSPTVAVTTHPVRPWSGSVNWVWREISFKTAFPLCWHHGTHKRTKKQGYNRTADCNYLGRFICQLQKLWWLVMYYNVLKN